MSHQAILLENRKASVSVVLQQLLLLKAKKTQAAELLRIGLGLLMAKQYKGSSRLCSGHLTCQREH